LDFKNIYQLGRVIPIAVSIDSVDKKLDFVKFQYKSKEIIATSVVVFLASLLVYLGVAFISPFIGYSVFFLGIILALVLYIYPTSIYYAQQLGEYSEEMLKALLRISTYISMQTSMEYAFIETTDHLRGTLKDQFSDIVASMKRKQKMTLGDALEPYVDTWNKINPIFVKSLRLLQTAAMSSQNEKEEIIKETLDTLIINYTSQSKRFAEDLASNANKLISVGVLLPILSLMLLPLMSVFMPDLVTLPVIAFVYIILFPVMTLLMSLNFASKRIQVDTVRIEESSEYRPLPSAIMWACIALAVIFSVPTIGFLTRSQNMTLASSESLLYVFLAWLMSFGIVLSIFIYSKIYVKRNEKLWNEVYEIEQDLPHLLQSFSTYLTLNISVENILPEIVEDYKKFGFSKHPVVKIFEKLNHILLTSKKRIEDIVENVLPKICPSKKVTNVINQIMSFTKISQSSAARAAKLVRSQTVAVYKLDDYIKTLLAETVSLINVTTTMLAPLLCAAAVIMSIAIVKSLNFITQQLAKIFSGMGGEGIDLTTLQLVDVAKIIPSPVIEVVVGLYLVETIVILSIFSTNVRIGNDRFRLLKTINSNMIGFVIYSALLFLGYYFLVEVLFKGILAA
jgi:hypothetical protein